MEEGGIFLQNIYTVDFIIFRIFSQGFAYATIFRALYLVYKLFGEAISLKSKNNIKYFIHRFLMFILICVGRRFCFEFERTKVFD
jgi:hypothetical protein